MKTFFNTLATIVLTLVVASTALANDCATANLITSQEDFADSQIAGSLVGAGYSGVAECTGPGARDDVWFRFVAAASKQGIRVTGTGDLSLSIEAYDGCGGTQLACQPPGGGSVNTLLLSGLTPGNTYYYRVYHAAAPPATATDFTTAVSHIPFVELSSEDCGLTDLTTNSIIRATDPSNSDGLTNYQFRFTELEAPFNTYTITSPNGDNPNFRMIWFPQVEYGRTYQVSVRVRAILPAYGDFGNTCVIGLQSNVLTPELESQYVNGFFGFCDWVGATGVGLATKYRWKFVDLSTLTTNVAFGDNNQRLLRLSAVPNLKLGETYIVSAYATVAGVESPDGPLKFMNMNNFVPNTGIRQDVYTCGATYAISSDIQAKEICMADSYTWRFRNTSQSQPDLFYTRSDGNRFIKLIWVTGLNVGDSYDVDIKATQGGLEGDYSAVCNITIGASLNPNLLIANDYLMDQENNEPTEPSLFFPDSNVDMAGTWSLNTRPESGNDGQVITVFGGDYSSDVIVSVYDLNGRLVAQRSMTIPSGSQSSWSLQGLDNGIYVIRAAGASHSEARKIVVF